MRTARIFLWLLLTFVSTSVFAQAPGPKEEVPPPPPAEEAPTTGKPKGTAISLEKATAIIRGADREVLAYLESFKDEALAKALHHVVTQRAVNVKLLLPAEVFSQPNSYAMAFAFLALRRNKLEVKVVAGGEGGPQNPSGRKGANGGLSPGRDPRGGKRTPSPFY